jgi:hypothetical protein
MLKKCNAIQFSSFLSALFLLVVCQVSFGISVVDKSLEQLLEQSDDVIYGVVTDISSRYVQGEPSQQIYTFITFSEIQGIKNPEANNQTEFLLRMAGGRVGSRAQVIPGAPRFQLGERYILFVRGNNKLAFPLVGVNQGVLRAVFDKTKSDYQLIFKKRSRRILEQFQALRENAGISSPDRLGADISPQEFMGALSSRWQQVNSEKRRNK